MWRSLLVILSLLTLLSSCNYLPDWLGKDEDEVILPGERVALKRSSELFKAEATNEDAVILLPDERRNIDWKQSLGNAAGVSDHLLLEQPLKLEHSQSLGAPYNTLLIPSPVIEGERIFALDGEGQINALNAQTLEPLWTSEALVKQDDEHLLGGGLAVSGSVLYAINDEGKVLALSTEDGKLYWQQSLKLPIRSAPRLVGKNLVILTADNQLISLNRRDGEPRWVHQGLSDQASQLQSTLPAAGGGVILATYTSGEVTALTAEEGTVLWTDVLAGSAQTALQDDRFGALSSIMTPRVSFAGSAKSFTAYLTQNGRRVWERRLPLLAQPWLTGTTLFAINTDYQLLAINGSNGKIIWVQPLAKKDDDSTIIWQHPVVASGTVWLVGNHGKLAAFDAKTGQPGTSIEIPAGVSAAPIIVDGTLYLLDKSATLHAVR